MEVETTKKTRSCQSIPNSNMPRKRVGADNSSTQMIEHDNAARELIFNNVPQSSPIFRLPLEIRKIIFEFVIGERVIDVHHQSVPRKVHHQKPDCSPVEGSSNIRRNTRKAARVLLAFQTKPSPLAIAATCRQFYQEAANVWYGTVRFCFHSVQCTQMFLQDIGDSNRDTIRHAGCNARWGPQDKLTKEILDILSTFPSLRTLTFEVFANIMIIPIQHRAIELARVESFYKPWEEEAQNLLSVRELLESVNLRTMDLIMKIDINAVAGPHMTKILGSRELKLSRCTGGVVNTTSNVEYTIDSVADLTRTEVCMRDHFRYVLRT
jgi:hypothetical protein